MQEVGFHGQFQNCRSSLIGLNSIIHMPTGNYNELFCKQISKQPIMENRTIPEISRPMGHLCCELFL